MYESVSLFSIFLHLCTNERDVYYIFISRPIKYV